MSHFGCISTEIVVCRRVEIFELLNFGTLVTGNLSHCKDQRYVKQEQLPASALMR
jgi:hypothetical protein